MQIIPKLHDECQVNFFSATYPPKIWDGIKKVINKRKQTKLITIRVNKVENLKVKGISQFYMKCIQEKEKSID